jgi:hypothetical protein
MIRRTALALTLTQPTRSFCSHRHAAARAGADGACKGTGRVVRFDLHAFLEALQSRTRRGCVRRCGRLCAAAGGDMARSIELTAP